MNEPTAQRKIERLKDVLRAYEAWEDAMFDQERDLGELPKMTYTAWSDLMDVRKRREDEMIGDGWDL